MNQRNWAGPIVLVSLVVTLCTACALIVFVWTENWQESVLLSGFALFGMVAVAFEVGFKTYWRLGRQLTFILIFVLPIAIAAFEYVRRLVA